MFSFRSGSRRWPTIPGPAPHVLRAAVAAISLLLPAFAVSSASAQTPAWMTGSQVVDQPGIYGTQGVPDPNNTPGARYGACSWSDSAGNLWVFGGYGRGSDPLTPGYLNDLWKYDAPSGSWTWMMGSSGTDQTGTYGDQGVPAPGNGPGARSDAVTWTDGAGNLWLFGGYNAAGQSYWNDLWKYDITSGNWAWMAGSDSANDFAAYGSPGLEEVPGWTRPGGRRKSAAWIDSDGYLWLFGGYGYNGGFADYLNELWRYNTETGAWRWMKGSQVGVKTAVYGTQGTPHPDNTPGARYSCATWTDTVGNLWLFGGDGYITNDDQGWLNDVWKYDVAMDNWTWVSGSNGLNQAGSYGMQGTPDSGNTPGARSAPASWTDSSGNFWLFGGLGHDGVFGQGNLNDLWKYSPGSKAWTWAAGSDAANMPSIYGTQGVAASDNIPGARSLSAGSRGPANTLYLFGGSGTGTPPGNALGDQNQLWAISLNASVEGTPELTGILFSSPSALNVTFSEAMSRGALRASSYTLSGAETGTLAPTPDSVTWLSGNTYRLTWNSGASTGNHVTLTVPTTLADVTGEAVNGGNSYVLPVTLSQFELQ